MNTFATFVSSQSVKRCPKLDNSVVGLSWPGGTTGIVMNSISHDSCNISTARTGALSWLRCLHLALPLLSITEGPLVVVDTVSTVFTFVPRVPRVAFRAAIVIAAIVTSWQAQNPTSSWVRPINSVFTCRALYIPTTNPSSSKSECKNARNP